MTDVMDFCRMSSIAFLVFIVSVSGQTSNENMCRVAAICDDDSPNIQSRKIQMNTVKGDRGYPGKMGSPGASGPPGTSEGDQETIVLDKLRQVTEVMSQKFEAFAQQMADVEVVAQRSESLVKSHLDNMWGGGGFTASNGYSYKTDSVESNYFEAKRICQKMGGQLAYEGLKNETVYSEIVEALRSTRRDLCIDLTDSASEGNFVLGDGAPVSWTNWGYNQPNNESSSDDCVYAIGRMGKIWDDVSCYSRCLPLCERQEV